MVGWSITVISYSLDVRDVQELGVPWPVWWLTANVIALLAISAWNLEMRLLGNRLSREVAEMQTEILRLKGDAEERLHQAEELLEAERRRAARPWYRWLLNRD